MKPPAPTFLSRFRIYQKERFPIFALLISLIPAVLSSGAVVSGHPMLLTVVLALIASVGFLLHIRIIDEHRDFEHDNIHYKLRPIQTGVITRAELRYIDFAVIALILGIAATAGAEACIAAFIMLAYSYLAGKEFFLGDTLRTHFFTYNSINLIQMLLLQVFIYSLFAGSIPLTILVGIHFLFTTTGTIIFEFVRKLKIPGEDGTGKDTYTWYLGFTNALWVHLALLLTNALLFLCVISLVSNHLIIWAFTAGIAMTLALSWIVLHRKQRNLKSERLLQLSFLLQYGIFNLIIYFVMM